MNLGANTQVGYTPPAMKQALKDDKRFQTEAKKHALRIVLIHGDALVLSGAAVEVRELLKYTARARRLTVRSNPIGWTSTWFVANGDHHA